MFAPPYFVSLLLRPDLKTSTQAGTLRKDRETIHADDTLAYAVDYFGGLIKI